MFNSSFTYFLCLHFDVPAITHKCEPSYFICSFLHSSFLFFSLETLRPISVVPSTVMEFVSRRLQKDIYQLLPVCRGESHARWRESLVVPCVQYKCGFATSPAQVSQIRMLQFCHQRKTDRPRDDLELGTTTAIQPLSL